MNLKERFRTAGNTPKSTSRRNSELTIEIDNAVAKNRLHFLDIGNFDGTAQRFKASLQSAVTTVPQCRYVLLSSHYEMLSLRFTFQVYN